MRWSKIAEELEGMKRDISQDKIDQIGKTETTLKEAMKLANELYKDIGYNEAIRDVVKFLLKFFRQLNKAGSL